MKLPKNLQSACAESRMLTFAGGAFWPHPKVYKKAVEQLEKY